MRSRYRTEEYAINNGDYRTSSPKMGTDEIAQIKTYIDQQDQLIVTQHNADKITQESRDTEQDSKIFQNATDIGINQTSITNLTNKNTEQDARLDALENRPVGTSGSMSMNQLVSEIVITDENQSVVFDNLDANRDGGYIMTVDTLIGDSNNYSIFLNGDTIPTNYSQVYHGTVAGESRTGYSNNSIFMAVNVNESAYSNLEISASGKILNHSIRSAGISFIMDVFSKTLLNNVTKIELGTIASIPIGSKFSLYKRKTEIKPSLVEEIVLDADSTSIVFDNLDAVADGGYELIFESGLASQASLISVYLNNDDIPTNYSRILSNINPNSSTPAVVHDEKPVISNTIPNEKTLSTTDISINGIIRSFETRTDDVNMDIGVYSKTPTTNITKLELRADVANGIPSGTKATLYRRKHDMVSGVNISSRAEGATDSTQLTIANATTESLSGTATSQSEVNAEFVTEISEHETRITTLEASSGGSGSYQLGDIILQNSEWVNDFVEINGMTFVKCNGVEVGSNNYPYVTFNPLFTPVGVGGEVAEIPINMTSNTSPAPLVASAAINNDAWQAFNETTAYAETGAWIKIDLGYGYRLDRYSMKATTIGTYAPVSWDFQGSNDDVAWTTIQSIAGQSWNDEEVKTFTVESLETYRYYRWANMPAQGQPPEVRIDRLRLYSISEAMYSSPVLKLNEPNLGVDIYHYTRIK